VIVIDCNRILIFLFLFLAFDLKRILKDQNGQKKEKDKHGFIFFRENLNFKSHQIKMDDG